MSKTANIRLDKFVANYSEFSRSDIKNLAKSGKITVDGQVVSDTSIKIHSEQEVCIAERRICPINDFILMLNKPKGYVCANQDSVHPTVIELIRNTKNSASAEFTPSDVIVNQIQIAGRLDIDTTGFVLLTNNGAWNHQITSPQKECFKRYSVTLDKPLRNIDPQLFLDGILLNGETKKTKPAKLSVLSKHTCELVISEGKYHQVKRMFAAIGNHVVKLHRSKIGNLQLDKNLELSEYRLLTPQEVELLLK